MRTQMYIHVHVHVHEYMSGVPDELCVFLADESANKLETAVQGLLACLAPPIQHVHEHEHVYTYTYMYKLTCTII